MIKLEQISLPIKFDDEEVKRQICKTLKIFPNSIDNFEILKLSVDARKKPNIKYVATFGVSLKGNMEKKFSNLTFEKQSYFCKRKPCKHSAWTKADNHNFFVSFFLLIFH